MATEGARKAYVRHRSAWWWTKNPRYILFQVREATSVFVVLYAFLLLWQMWALRGGAASYAAFLDLWYSRPFVVLHVVVLAFVLLHGVTWFLLTTKVPLFRVHGRPPPAWMPVGSMFAIWAVATVLVLKLLYGWF